MYMYMYVAIFIQCTVAVNKRLTFRTVPTIVLAYRKGIILSLSVVVVCPRKTKVRIKCSADRNYVRTHARVYARA